MLFFDHLHSTSKVSVSISLFFFQRIFNCLRNILTQNKDIEVDSVQKLYFVQPTPKNFLT